MDGCVSKVCVCVLLGLVSVNVNELVGVFVCDAVGELNSLLIG